jgi:uncharacterized hydrophobic protein (TIGR00271 family)
MSDPTTLESSSGSLLRHLASLGRGKLAALCEVTPESRLALLQGMLKRHDSESFSYWFQLLLSMGIATLGLVLGSTGVVIGAMLVAPLMGPILQTGMGLAVGSAVLVVRAALRTALSIAGVVLGAAAITLTLPYHEVNAEIAARTSPTALDLLLAAFCALVAAFTTVRRGSDTASAAAGTAIGISLVPPLCVVGWGLGTQHWHLAAGASLLFTANFCAIVLVAALLFALLGMEQVPLAELERASLGAESRLDRFADRVRRLFGSRYGSLLRLAMPVAVLAAVYVPLRKALEEVAWQVRVRSGVQRMVDEVLPTRRAVQSVLSVGRNAVALRLVLVAREEDAQAIQRDLGERIAALAGVVPKVEVVAVPDVEAVRQASLALANSARALPVEPPPPPPWRPDLPRLREHLAGLLQQEWPESVAGPLLTWRLELPPGQAPRLEVLHLGEPLGRAGELLLSRALAQRLEGPLEVREVVLPAQELAAPAAEGMAWLPGLVRGVAVAERHAGLSACVEVPAPERREREDSPLVALRRTVATELERLPAERWLLRQGSRWAVRLSTAPCMPPEPAATEAPSTPASPAAGPANGG